MFSLQSVVKNQTVLIVVVLVVVAGFVIYFLHPSMIKEGLTDFISGAEKALSANPEEDPSTVKVEYTEDPIEGADFVEGSSEPITPEDLLPKSVDANAFDAANPVVGGSPLDAKNFLASGYSIGINTVGNSNRNSNLSLRSDPPIPVVPTGPWNQTTILPDLERKGLDIC